MLFTAWYKNGFCPFHDNYNEAKSYGWLGGWATHWASKRKPMGDVTETTSIFHTIYGHGKKLTEKICFLIKLGITAGLNPVSTEWGTGSNHDGHHHNNHTQHDAHPFIHIQRLFTQYDICNKNALRGVCPFSTNIFISHPPSSSPRGCSYVWISNRQHDNICESLQSSIKRARTFSCIRITTLDGKGCQQQAISCVRGSCMRCKLLWMIVLASQWDVCLILYCCDNFCFYSIGGAGGGSSMATAESCSIRGSYISEALQAHAHKQPFRS